MKKMARLLGIDAAIGLVILGRGWSAVAGVVTLFLVSRSLSSAEQGYYFTFASVLALQIFFELGFSSVLAQFAGHEMPRLSWQGGRLVGEKVALQRILSLFRLCVCWYGVISVLVIGVVLPAGLNFFDLPRADVHWRLPWALLVLSAAGNLFLSPFIVLMEATGFVRQVARMRLVQGLFANFIIWIALSSGLRLWAAPIFSIGLLVTALGWLIVNGLGPLQQALKEDQKHAISWRREIWPMQWRIALSWMSGYFIFQSFNPLAFRYQGAETAGRLGMGLAICNLLSSLAMAWISTKNPLFCRLIAEGRRKELDLMFGGALRQSLRFLAGAVLLLPMGVWLVGAIYPQLGGRLLDAKGMFVLGVTVLFNYVIYAQATYVRAHKVERYLWHALISAVFMIALCYVGVRYYSIYHMLAAYALVSMGGMLYSNVIFSRFRKSKVAA